MELYKHKCSFIVGDAGTGKTKFANSKINEFDKNEYLFVLSQYSDEYKQTLNNKYGAANVQTINLDYKKKLDIFSFHYPVKVDNFSDYFNSYVHNLVDFLKSTFGIHEDDLPAIKNIVIDMFNSKNITNTKEPDSLKVTFLYSDFYYFIGLKEQHLAYYFHHFDLFVTKEDAVKNIFNSSVTLEKFNKKIVLINLNSANSNKYYHLYLSFLIFEIQILNLNLSQKTKIIVDDLHYPNNLFYFFEQKRFSKIEFYFVSQSTIYLKDLYLPEDIEQNFYIFKLRRFHTSLFPILPQNKKNEVADKISKLKNGEYYSNRNDVYLSIKL